MVQSAIALASHILIIGQHLLGSVYHLIRRSLGMRHPATVMAIALLTLFAVSCVPSLPSIGTAAHESVKWHPGYYVKLSKGRWRELESRPAFRDVLNSPYITGVEVDLFWRQLEPRKGQYDLSALHQILDIVDRHDKHLLLMVLDRSFWNHCEGEENPVPDYLYAEDAVLPLRNGPGNPGCAAAIWRPDVMERYVNLLEAIAQEFDTHPRFAAIATPESALGVAVSEDEQDYRTALKDQLIQAIHAIKTHFSHTLVLASLNYLGGRDNLNAYAQAVAALPGTGISTPDTLPGDGVNGMDVYQIMHDLKGTVAIAPQANTSELAPRDTEDQINDFAATELGANILIWASWRRNQDDYIRRVILPLTEQILNSPHQHGQLHHTCPTNFRCT